MNRFRKIGASPVVAGFLSIIMLLFSCSREQIVSGGSPVTGRELMKAIYFLDGELIDRIEPLADLKLEAILEPELVTTMRSHIDNFLDQLEEKYPGTFETFREEMTSGDHVAINQSITRNAQLIYSAIQGMNQGDSKISSLTDMRSQPLAQIIESNFPSRQDITAAEIRDGLTSENFKRDIANYFENLDMKIDTSNGRAEDQMCVLWGAAVVAFAAIAIAVIYVIAVLNAVETANIVHYVWATESEVTTSSLLKEQIVNAAATNLYEGD